MYVYAMACSDQGPTKIGKATDPEKRLRALKTGNHELRLHHAELVVYGAESVERTVHLALRAKHLDGEWFSISPQEAREAIKGAATNAKLLVDETSTLSELHCRAIDTWLEDCSEFDRKREEGGQDDGEEYQVAAPDVVASIALDTRAGRVGRFSFNDYLLTWPEGMWHRWARQRMGKPEPRGGSFKPYLEADDFLEERNGKFGRKVAERWLEWSAARALNRDEAHFLSEIWDIFVPAWIKVASKGPHWDTHGIDDHVDDVYLYVLSGDRDRGDGDYIVFWHDHFRAVLIPDRRTKLFDREIQKLKGAPVSGFVAPVLSSEVWDVPFRPWLCGAPERRDDAIATFLSNPAKRFPAPRPYDGIQPASVVWHRLDCIDEEGLF